MRSAAPRRTRWWQGYFVIDAALETGEQMGDSALGFGNRRQDMASTQESRLGAERLPLKRVHGSTLAAAPQQVPTI